tara:strand:+ start:129 stop:335 length:207 start_codon:yes stop_codon:yes gene_type:complete
VPDAVDFGLKCTACPLPFPAIEFFTAWLQAWRVGVTFNLGIANVAENLQIVDRIGSAFTLWHYVVDLE